METEGPQAAIAAKDDAGHERAAERNRFDSAVLASGKVSVEDLRKIRRFAAEKGERVDRMLVELGFEPSVVGVARLYSPVAATLVIDTVDAEHAEAVEAAGMQCVVTPTIMAEPGVGASLATACLAAARVSDRRTPDPGDSDREK